MSALELLPNGSIPAQDPAQRRGLGPVRPLHLRDLLKQEYHQPTDPTEGGHGGAFHRGMVGLHRLCHGTVHYRRFVVGRLLIGFSGVSPKPSAPMESYLFLLQSCIP